MHFDVTNLTQGEVELICWQYRNQSGFDEALWKAIKLADDGNLAKLRAGFPSQVAAYLGYTGLKGYWHDVKVRAGIEQEETNHD